MTTTYRFGPQAARAIHQLDQAAANAGLPIYSDLLNALTKATLVLDGRSTKKAEALKKATTLLNVLHPDKGLGAIVEKSAALPQPLNC